MEKTVVGGPIKSPTAHVPNRPMLAAGLTNALFVNQASAVGLATFPSPTQSGRCDAVKPRTVVPVPDGSALLKDGVRNAPDCSSVTPVRSQPPINRSRPGPAAPPMARPRPNGNSTMKVLTNRWRRVKATLPKSASPRNRSSVVAPFSPVKLEGTAPPESERLRANV